MSVTTEDVCPALADVLRVGGVLEGEQAEESFLGLLVKVITAVGDSKQISILVTPLEICNLRRKEEIRRNLELEGTLFLQSLFFWIKLCIILVHWLCVFKSPKREESSLKIIFLL